VRRTCRYLLLLAATWLLVVALPLGLVTDRWNFAWPGVGMMLFGVPLYLLLGPDERPEP